MPRYSSKFQDTADSTLAAGGILSDATTPRRVKLYDYNFGSEATPADSAFLWILQRGITGLGTSTALTPSPLDPGDPVAITDFGENFTVNPTLGVILFEQALNQRSSFRWVAFPGSEFVMAAAANGSIISRTPTSSAVVISGTIFFEE